MLLIVPNQCLLRPYSFYLLTLLFQQNDVIIACHALIVKHVAVKLKV